MRVLAVAGARICCGREHFDANLKELFSKAGLYRGELDPSNLVAEPGS
jgi:hypothetical protein